VTEGVGSTTTAIAEWALGLATIGALLEAGVIGEPVAKRIATLMEEHADRYAQDGRVADAGEIRACARRLRELLGAE
jgi:Na+/glutamate symporter